MSSIQLASDFYQKLTKTFKPGLMAEMRIAPSFVKAHAMAKEAGATYVEALAAPHPAEEDGVKVRDAAEVLLARFGEADEAVWVAFVVFKKGWSGVYRPFTEDTATMPWLDAFVAKQKLVG